MDSIKYNNVYIKNYYTIGGLLEKQSHINNCDEYIKDYYDGAKTVEECEINLQKKCIEKLLQKNNYQDNNIDLLIGGDLLNQLTATNFSAKNFNIPLIGTYAACATFPLLCILAGTLIDSKKKKNIVVVTSSHNLTSEKQFRFPIEYGAIKKCYTTFTSTGACSVLLQNEVSNIKIESSTIGRVIDSEIKDAYQMGGVMAIAAYETLIRHLSDMKRDAKYYDLILTGDLGYYGENIFKDVLKEKNISVKKYMDAGANIYKDNQEVYSGASGPLALPLYFFNKVLNQKKYKKVLLIGTGSLHSPVMVNQKKTIPSIAHAISIEVID